MNEQFSNRKGKSCVIYIRVSSERQVKGYSLEGQMRYLKEWAEFEGMSVSKVYVEEGKSGKSIDGRDKFQTMLQDIANREIPVDYVVVFKLSRFGRNCKDVLNSLTYIQRYGVNLICKEDGLDSSTVMGKMMITILGAVAEMERENILTQTYLGRVEKAKQGGWNGGFAPFGYTLYKETSDDDTSKIKSTLIVNEDEASIIKLVFDKFVNEGLGYSTIAGYLNKQGIVKKASKNSHGRTFTDWDINQIKRMLSNPLYTGRIAFGRTRAEKIEGTESDYRRVKADDYILSDGVSHEAIISDELFEKAQRKKAESSTGKPVVGRGSKHLLSGILRCPMCGSSMYADIVQWTNKDGMKRTKLNYQCGHYAKAKHGNCKKNSILGEWIESEVIAYTKLLVRNPLFVQDIQSKIGQKVDVSEINLEINNYQKSVARLEKSKYKLEQDIDNLLEEDKHAERKRKDMNKRLNKLYEEIYELEDQISECEQREQSAEHKQLSTESIYKILWAFDQLFDIMSREEQRKVLESLIAEVYLYPKETWQEGQNPIREIKYTFPVSPEVLEELRGNVLSVESVALLTRKAQ